MTDDDTARSTRRRARAPEDDDETRVSTRERAGAAPDATRASRRRVAEGETQPAEAELPTQEMPIVEDGVLRRPAGLDGEEPRTGEFGREPQHYYPRLRYTVTPLRPGDPASAAHPDGARVLDPSQREARHASARRRRAARIVAVAAASLLAAAAGVALVLIVV